MPENFEPTPDQADEQPDWKRQFAQLESGEVRSETFTPQQLFELATDAAISGDYGAKAKIYQEYIFNHPEASDDDKFRVEIYQQDLTRRNGDPKTALAELESLREKYATNEAAADTEYFHAVGQCHLMLGQLDQAVASNREVLSHCDDSIPSDKQLYFMESMMAVKLASGKPDEELDELFSRYQALLDASDLGELHRNRALSALYSLQGTAAVEKGDSNAAAESYRQFFAVAPSDRDKTVAALRYLAIRLLEPIERQAEDVQTLTDFFRSHHDLLQATDIAALQNEYDSVTQTLNIERSRQ